MIEFTSKNIMALFYDFKCISISSIHMAKSTPFDMKTLIVQARGPLLSTEPYYLAQPLCHSRPLQCLSNISVTLQVLIFFIYSSIWMIGSNKMSSNSSTWIGKELWFTPVCSLSPTGWSWIDKFHNTLISVEQHQTCSPPWLLPESSALKSHIQESSNLTVPHLIIFPTDHVRNNVLIGGLKLILPSTAYRLLWLPTLCSSKGSKVGDKLTCLHLLSCNYRN